jgi:hypothetical protein
MRQCSKCKQPKPESEFYQSNIRKATYCKSCFNKYTIQRWQDRKIQAIQYKGSSCIDCSISYPETPYQVFDFHHLDMNEKEYDWTKLRLRSWEDIKTELDKCVLLCANCHRIRHINN